MSEHIHLNAEPRSVSGKGASRRLRHENLVPAIVYGGDHDPVTISIKQNEFIHELENEAIYTQIINLQVGSTTEEVILRDLQRHPYKNKVLHADFYRIDNKKPLKVVVPIHILNAEECVGVKTDGGMLTHLISEIEIISLPKDLPEYLEIDAENLHLGETLHLSDITLPSGVEIVSLTHVDEEDEHDAHDMGVLAVVKTRAEEEISDEAPEAPETEGDEETEDGDDSEGDNKGEE
tara:strand:+ start:135 stop:839 length:705 start_codon:yes stop_codon:yes gene_type:complete